MAVKRISIAGSTGSIGTQTLDEVRKRPGEVEVVGLSCNSRIDVLEKQIREFKPRFAAVVDPEKADLLRRRIKDTKTEVFDDPGGIFYACIEPKVDLVVIASVGLEAFITTVQAVNWGRDIAPASKEPFVFGSEILVPLIVDRGVNVYPIDSEHSAIWQCVVEKNIGKAAANGNGCIVGIDTSGVRKVWLGCSGGPFYGRDWEYLKGVTVDQALKHPTWNMGGLITINSATLYNKGQEISEARVLFGLEFEKIDVTVDRTSMIHAIVEFEDGSRLMNFSKPDMHDPIRFALFGERDRSHIRPAGDVKIVAPDRNTFRLLRIAEEVAKTGGTLPAAMVAANGAAVESFTNKVVSFTEMIEMVEETVKRHRVKSGYKELEIADAYNWGDYNVRAMILARHESLAMEDEPPASS